MSLPTISSRLIQRDRGFKFRRVALALFAAFAPSATILRTLLSPAMGAESVTIWKATPVRPYVVRGSNRRHLDRAEQFAASEQWDDALSAILRLLAAADSSVVAIEHDLSRGHYVSLPEYCHRLLARFPADSLARYRQLVDATSKSWYEQGIAERDEQLLQRIVDEHFCSRWGDDALLALGELALERGDFQVARSAWQQISPQLIASANLLSYPDTDLSLAAVQARLVLVSLREANWQRAERELAQLREDFPAVVGRLGGREVVLADHLTSMLKQARQWPSAPMSSDWLTFAASPHRTSARDLPSPLGRCELLWSQPLANQRLGSFPIVVNDWVIYQDHSVVQARSLSDGRAVFTAAGDAFRIPQQPAGWLGQPWQTLTAHGNRVFGITATALGPRRKSGSADTSSACWGIDLQRQGALAFHLPSDEPEVAFVGAPLVVGSRLWVACRENGQTTRAGIACYDLDSHERLWQRWLCQANTPATGRTNELATNLLTYDAGIIYLSTNLGAIAAVRGDDGHLLWLRTYERECADRSRAEDCDYYRGPHPCVYYHGVVLALPTDGRYVYAFDAGTAAELWRAAVDDPMAELVGVSDGRVILSHRGLQVRDLTTGELVGHVEAQLTGWPAVLNYSGRGQVLWPHDVRVDAFDVNAAPSPDDGFKLPEPGGANLLVAGDFLVAAGPSQLSVFRFQNRAVKSPQDSQTSLKE